MILIRILLCILAPTRLGAVTTNQEFFRIMSQRFLNRKTFTLGSIGAAALAAALAAPSVLAQQKVLNIYSARHYQTDQALYDAFAKANNVKINRVDTDDAGVLQRLKAEGSASPADVVLLVDASRLAKADADGLFAQIKSPVLEKAIPAQYRDSSTANGTTWYGFSTRARVIVYNKTKVKPADVDSYEKLASAANRGKVCTRSGSHPYNLSLFSTMVEHIGADKTQAVLQGMVGNMARAPKGGDTDQIKAVASGECGVALTNSYYLARMMRSGNPADRAVIEKVGVVFPNQGSWGTHMNIAGGAVAKHSKNKQLAQQFLEYLASAKAQDYFANGNNEWPVVKGVSLPNPALRAMTSGKSFKSETIPVAVVGKHQTRVQQLLDRVGYK